MTHDYQFHINGLKALKPLLQKIMLAENYEGMGGIDAAEIGETIGLAIEALEKQIPKKPVHIESLGTCMFTGDCPVCGEPVASYEEYCDKCGQALDWSEERMNYIEDPVRDVGIGTPIPRSEVKDLPPKEVYTLTLTHEYVDPSGKHFKMDEPIKCNVTIDKSNQIGLHAVNENQIMNFLWNEMMKHKGLRG